jgi:hypothetical protein
MVLEIPPRDAVTTALPERGPLPAVAVKLLEADPAGTVTEPGTERDPWLLDKVTMEPPVGALPESATAQFVDVWEPRSVGVQVSADSSTGGVVDNGSTVKVTLCVLPPALAEMVVVSLFVTCSALAVNIALLAP